MIFGFCQIIPFACTEIMADETFQIEGRLTEKLFQEIELDKRISILVDESAIILDSRGKRITMGSVPLHYMLSVKFKKVKDKNKEGKIQEKLVATQIKIIPE
jgi:hypothetical protein